MIQITQNVNAELTDNTRNGECICCGDCCADMIALTQTDIARIKRYMKKHNITKPEDHTKAYGLLNPHAMQTLDLTCPFLTVEKVGLTPGAQKATCRIYSVRPAVCKAFTCKLASDPSQMAKIHEALKKDLTPKEVLQLTSSAPVSMRATFFGK